MADHILRTVLTGDTRGLERSFKKADAAGASFNRKMTGAAKATKRSQSAFSGLGRTVVGLGAAYLGASGLTSAVRASFEEMSQSAKVTAQTNAVLKSTGGVAGVTTGHVEKLGTALLKKSGIDDEVVRSGENMLLTFRNIRNVAGKGNDIFDQTTRATLDMDAAMTHGNVTQESLAKSSIRVGKALNDPIKGVTALRRVGVQFTAQQTAQIKALVDSGHTMAAQKIILRELNAEFGGSAAAIGGTLPGKINIARESFRDLGGTLATQLVPTLTKTIDRVNKWISNTENVAKVQRIFRQVVAGVTSVLNATHGAFQALNVVTRSTANSVKLLLGAFVAFKALRIGSSIATAATNMSLFSRNTRVAAGNVKKLSGIRAAIGKLTSAPYLITFTFVAVGAKVIANKIAGLQKQALDAEAAGFKKGDPVETTLVPRLAKQIKAMKKAGQSSKTILSTLRKQLGGSLKADDLIGEAFAFSANADPKTKSRIEKAIKKRAEVVKKAVKKAVPPSDPAKAPAGKSANELAAQANSFFDARISRQLSRVPEGAGQLGALSKVAALLTARIGKTRDVTRKLNLEDQLLDVVKQQRAIRKQRHDDAAAALADSLQFGLEKAQATKGTGDDLAALSKIDANIRSRIKREGKTTDLQRQLFDVRTQAKEVRKQSADTAREALTARGFRTLGLDASGDTLTPNKASLKKQLGSLSNSVKGTVLDTGKTRGLLARVRKALSDGIVPKDVRAKIREMLDGVKDELNNSGNLNKTKFRHTNANALLAGLGLTPQQLRAARGRLATVGAGGTVPGARSLAFAGQQTTVVHTNVHMDGKVVAKSTTTHQRKAKTRRSASRRGPFAGND
jgi:hypothetical protein